MASGSRPSHDATTSPGTGGWAAPSDSTTTVVRSSQASASPSRRTGGPRLAGGSPGETGATPAGPALVHGHGGRQVGAPQIVDLPAAPGDPGDQRDARQEVGQLGVVDRPAERGAGQRGVERTEVREQREVPPPLGAERRQDLLPHVGGVEAGPGAARHLGEGRPAPTVGEAAGGHVPLGGERRQLGLGEAQVVAADRQQVALDLAARQPEGWRPPTAQHDVAVGRQVGDEAAEGLGAGRVVGQLVEVVDHERDLGLAALPEQVDGAGDQLVRRPGRPAPERLDQPRGERRRRGVVGCAGQPVVDAAWCEPVLGDALRQRGGLAQARWGHDGHDRQGEPLGQQPDEPRACDRRPAGQRRCQAEPTARRCRHDPPTVGRAARIAASRGWPRAGEHDPTRPSQATGGCRRTIPRWERRRGRHDRGPGHGVGAPGDLEVRLPDLPPARPGGLASVVDGQPRHRPRRVGGVVEEGQRARPGPLRAARRGSAVLRLDRLDGEHPR